MFDAKHLRTAMLLLPGLLVGRMGRAADDAALRKSVTFHASFDESLQADFAQGKRSPRTRFTKDRKQRLYTVQPTVDAKVFRIAKGKGVHGGALRASDVLPRAGRIFFPLKGNLAVRKSGWGGSVSVWINTNPDTMLKTKYCDPVQITEKGATNGGIWFDFTPDKPRDMRMGVFNTLKPGEKPIPQNSPKAPLIIVKDVGFRSGDWHHIVLTWNNVDTDKADGQAAFYVDGKRVGRLKNRRIVMNWNTEKAGIYFAVNYIGLFDELALFNRPLTAAEVKRLHKQPGLLSGLVSAGSGQTP